MIIVKYELTYRTTADGDLSVTWLFMRVSVCILESVAYAAPFNIKHGLTDW